ncbi:MAG: hypothetical protein ACRCY7_00025 [Cetobacterium sp.]|uniref:hypothetical protein n=1 Tax=Cetobacterium sp. TaxID=2071632 RepID=UPI003F3CEF88
MINFNDLIVHKPNHLIEIVGNPISTMGLLTYNYLLHKFQKEKTDKLTLSPNEIFKSLEISDKYEDLYEYLDSLLSIKVRSLDKKGKLWSGFNLLSSFEKTENGIFIQIPEPIFKALCGNEKEKTLYYTTIKLLEQRVYRCSYTIIFYELFKKYEKINIPLYELETLKNITGTQNKYKIYYDFKKRVLTPALKELNQFDQNFDYSFDEEYLGRKVNKIKFKRTSKNIIEISDSQISNKLLKAIEKSRKNRFINSSYSQKAMEKLLQKYDETDIIKALGELYKYNLEIRSFSKILTAKIEDIKNSNLTKIKEKTIPILDQKEKQTLIKDDFIEQEKSILDIEKEKISILIKNSGLPTNKRINLMIKLSEIKNLEELEKLKKFINF